ncbi:hypothetical protein IPM62_03070 [Candidatus Woesebacteria bacterium]|nr:MAG: hypothetical protein IPM62_03070 [Candidatus Woesebacteria bacterium]
MDPKYEELEKDIVEEHGGGRVWQEMAKNPARGEGTVSAFPQGTPKRVIEHRMRKTEEAVGTRRTQVRRTESE